MGARACLALAVGALVGVTQCSAQEEEQRVTRGMVVKRLGSSSLACHACRMAMDRFRYNVARRITAKMGAEKRQKVFWSRLGDICQNKSFPMLLAVAGETGKEIYEDVHAAATEKRKFNIRQMSPEVKQDVIAACKYFIEGHQDELLRAVLKSKGARASEENFHRLICVKPSFCKAEDIPNSVSDDEAEDENEDL